LDVQTRFVAIPLFDGEKGIGPNHAPLIARLGCGELRLKRAGGETVRLYIDGGFVQVADNVVSLLTDRAIPAEEVKEDAARDLLQTTLKRKAASDEEIDAREKTVNQARAQMRVARRAK
jgi:F-type H+-transporting ATPase subunit epsilon